MALKNMMAFATFDQTKDFSDQLEVFDSAMAACIFELAGFTVTCTQKGKPRLAGGVTAVTKCLVNMPDGTAQELADNGALLGQIVVNGTLTACVKLKLATITGKPAALIDAVYSLQTALANEPAGLVGTGTGGGAVQLNLVPTISEVGFPQFELIASADIIAAATAGVAYSITALSAPTEAAVQTLLLSPAGFAGFGTPMTGEWAMALQAIADLSTDVTWDEAASFTPNAVSLKKDTVEVGTTTSFGITTPVAFIATNVSQFVQGADLNFVLQTQVFLFDLGPPVGVGNLFKQYSENFIGEGGAPGISVNGATGSVLLTNTTGSTILAGASVGQMAVINGATILP